MKHLSPTAPLTLLAAVSFLTTAAPLVAGPVVTGPTQPAVAAEDFANLTWVGTNTDQTWTDTTNHGQSLTTGNETGYLLRSFSMQVDSASKPVLTNARLKVVINP